MNFNTEKLNNLMSFYKKSFIEHWNEEKYKWQAVKHFQENWDINAENFALMFAKATSDKKGKTWNFLVSQNFFPAKMIENFAIKDPDATRKMFEVLYNDNINLSERVEYFKNESDKILRTFDAELKKTSPDSKGWGMHYQTDNAISAYLWLRFPQKYYIYKWSEFKNIARELDCPVKFTKGHKENLENGFALYDLICEELSKNNEIKNSLYTQLTEDCYSDDALKTLTMDFGFHVSRYYKDSEWLPRGYNPGISKEKWIELINDKAVFNDGSLITFACLQNSKISTCAGMAKEFGRTWQFYNNNGWQTGQRVFRKVGKQPPKDENDEIWFWSACCCFRKNNDNFWEFMVHPELQEAFDETGILDEIELYEKGEAEMNYWLVNPKSDGSETDLSELSMDCVFMGWDKNSSPKFYNEVRKGDVIIVAEKAHANAKVHFVGIAEILDEKNQCWSLSYSSADINKEVESIIRGNPSDFGGGESPNPWGATKSIIKVLDNPAEKKLKELLNNFFKGKNMEDTIGQCKQLLLNTHNLILHGAPGTGKTHLAKEIAKELNAEVGFVQFHPSYDYTDFVEGLRPVNNGEQIGFECKNGVFKEFCERAIKNSVDNLSDNFDEIWNKLIELLNENDFIEVPLLTGRATMRIELNEYGDGLANRTYESDEYQQGKWIRGQSKFFTKEQCYNIYKGLKGIPSGGHDNYRKAIVKYMKDNMGLKEYKEGIEKYENKKPFVFIIDEINRGEISKIFGELFFSMDPGYRGKKGLIKTQYQNLIQENNVFYDGFYVPENVYIIGTMNDIDRSVESMDFAFRRRFTFKEIKANENLGMLDKLDESIREKAKRTLRTLNNAISEVDGLSSAYHIGGAYFLKLNELDNDFDKLWNYHLEGLLREYLRGMEDSESILEKLHEAYTNGQEA